MDRARPVYDNARTYDKRVAGASGTPSPGPSGVECEKPIESVTQTATRRRLRVCGRGNKSSRTTFCQTMNEACRCAHGRIIHDQLIGRAYNCAHAHMCDSSSTCTQAANLISVQCVYMFLTHRAVKLSYDRVRFCPPTHKVACAHMETCAHTLGVFVCFVDTYADCMPISGEIIERHSP